MPWTEIASLVKDIVLSIAGVVASSCAIVGLFTWKRELRGKTKYLAAHRLLKATYTLREAIVIVRNPFIDASEFPSDYNDSNGSTRAREEAAAYSQVYTDRWKYVSDCIGDFQTNAMEAEAIWGNEIKEATDSYTNQLSYLRTAIRQYIRNKQLTGIEEHPDQEEKRRIESIIWSENLSGSTVFTHTLNDKIKTIEDFLLPHLGRS